MADRPRRVVALVPFDLWELIVQHARESDDLHQRVLVERAVTKTIAENLFDVPMEGAAAAPADLLRSLEESANRVAGLSADVTRLEAERDRVYEVLIRTRHRAAEKAREARAAEVRVKELEGRLEAHSSNTDEVRGLLSDCRDYFQTYDTLERTDGRTSPIRPRLDAALARLDALQSSALPVPVPVGPDGETAGSEANSAKSAEVRGKADA